MVFCLGFALVSWNWRVAVAEREAKEEERQKANIAGTEARAARDMAVIEEKKARAAAARALAEETKAREAAERASRSLYSSLIDRARLEQHAANIAESDAILDRCEPGRRGWEWHFLKGLNHAELLTLSGHGEGAWVDSVAYSPDGTRIATAGGGDPFYANPGGTVVPDTIIVWEPESGRPLYTIRQQKHLVSELAFSPDGRLLGSSSLDGTINVHEAATGRLLRTIRAGESEPPARGFRLRVPAQLLAFTPDGKSVGSNTVDQDYALWDIATATRKVLLRAVKHGYRRASFSPDGRFLATLSGVFTARGYGDIRVWSSASGAEVNLPEKNGDHFSLAWSSDGRTLAGGGSGFIALWNPSSGKLERVLTGHEGRVLAVAFRPDGERLASVGDDRTVRIWNTETGELRRVIRGHTNIVTCLAFSPDGDRLVTGSHDGTARVWDLTKDEETGCVDERDRGYPLIAVDAIASARGGREALLFYRDGQVLRLETGSLDRLAEIVADSEIPWMTPAEPAAFDAEGHRLITIDPRVRREANCLELDGRRQRTNLRGHEFSIRFVTLSADGSRAATAGSSDAKAPIRKCEILVWDAASGRLVHRRHRINEAVTRIALDPTGKRLAIAGVDLAGTGDNPRQGAAAFVAVIDVASGREVLRHTVPDDQLWAVRFSADGRRLAAAGVERTLLIWDLDTRGLLAQTRQGPEGAMDVDFGPDGRRLAIASRHHVTLADAETAEAVLILRGKPQLTPNSHGFNPRVRFSSDGRSLLAVCDDHLDSFAEWALTGPGSEDREARLRPVRRRAANQHLGRSLWLTWKYPDRSVNYDLDHAERYGLETAMQYLKLAEVRAARGEWSRVEDDLNRAVAKDPDDDTIVAKAAIVYADCGRFSTAGVWFARMSRVAPFLSCVNWWRHGPNLVLAGDQAHYRVFAEALWQRFQGALDAATRCDLAYACALTPARSPHTEELLRIARQGCAQTLSAKDTAKHGFALIVLGAVQLQAGGYQCAEASLLAALARAHDDFGRALARAWLTIALAREGRRDDAKACFDQADRFLRAQVNDGRPEREQPAPSTLVPHDWWRLLLAWREAQSLILDGPFPANSLGR